MLETLLLLLWPAEEDAKLDVGGDGYGSLCSGLTRYVVPAPDTVAASRLVLEEVDGDDSGSGAVYGSVLAGAPRIGGETDCGGWNVCWCGESPSIEDNPPVEGVKRTFLEGISIGTEPEPFSSQLPTPPTPPALVGPSI